MKNIPWYQKRTINTIQELLETSTEMFGNNVAYYSKKNGKYESTLYKQVKDDVNKLGTALTHLGIKDQRIAIIGENRYEWAVSYFATVCGTGVAVPLDRQLPENEIALCMKRADVKAVIYSSKLSNSINNIIDKTNVSILIDMDLDEDTDKVFSYRKLMEKGEKLLAQGNKDFTNANVNSKDIAEILFTSGTTSESKAVMLSHKNIAFNISKHNTMIDIKETDIFLSVLPIHHTYECTCGFMTPFFNGSAVAYCEGLKYVAENLKESHSTIILAVPALFEMMYGKIWAGIRKKGKEKTVKTMIKVTNFLDKIGIHIKRKIFKDIHEQFGGNLRMLIAGAAAINPEVSQGFRDIGLLSIQGYGLSECSPIVALNRDVDYKDSAAGLPLPGIEVKISEPNEEGVGEIITKGEHVMMGYYENEEATNEAIKDGWFYTGDMGYIDGDGFVYITGRKKNVIITKNGKNVYPEEIENLLIESPYVKECMVYGKQINDDITISAQILLDKEYIKEKFGETKSDEEIKALVWEDVKDINQKLVIYKHVRNIEIREKEFEKTTTLKIKRYKESIT